MPIWVRNYMCLQIRLYGTVSLRHIYHSHITTPWLEISSPKPMTHICIETFNVNTLT